MENPKEEPKQDTLSESIKQVITNKLKQETLEEYIEKSYPRDGSRYDFTVTRKIRNGIREGVKWQQERSYSEEEVRKAFDAGLQYMIDGELNKKNWFEQFKKK